MVTIKVVYSSVSPAQGCRVCLGFTFGMSEEVYTDEYGEADFSDIEPGRTGSIYIDGMERYSDRPLPAKKTISL